MAIKERDYIQEGLPVETGLGNAIYLIVSNCMYNKRHTEIQQSGLYRIKAVYPPEPEQVVPALFGTFYNGKDYAEIHFLKAQKHKLGKLEITLFGKNKRRLKKIQNKIKIRIENLLKKENGHKGQ